MPVFNVDLNAPRQPFDHYWEACVGSCHGPTALREDYRRQLRRCHNELGFRYVRFHGILDDSMSVCLRDHRDGTLRYNFTLIDSIFDFLLSIGMKPFIELSFMPSALASTGKELFAYRGNISIPRSYDEWDGMIEKLTAHLVERYGLNEVRMWFFEVWNEPNLAFFYEGTQQDYFELYDHTAAAIKRVDEGLRVGGPATAINAWIPDMIRHCEQNDIPLDFISTHHYPTDDPLWNSGMSIEAFFASMAKDDPDAEKKLQAHRRGVLTIMLKQACEEAGDYPLYYTEWNSSARDTDLRHELPYTSAFVAKTLIDNAGLVDVYSFWTFSDIFEENGQRPGEFHGGFGMMTLHGIPKPVYRLFQLMHGLGDMRLKAEGEQGTVGLVATEENGVVQALVYNHDVLEHPPVEERVTLKLAGMAPKRAEILRIDDDHANPYPLWVKMGSPDYPTDAQLHTLMAESALQAEPLALENGEVSFALPPHGVALVRLYD